MIATSAHWYVRLQRLFCLPEDRSRAALSRAAVWCRLPKREEFAALPYSVRGIAFGLTGLVVLVWTLTLSGLIAIELSASRLPWLGPAGRKSSTEVRDARMYDHIADRPVFARTRQAQAIVADTPPPVVAELDQSMVLRGVFINGVAAKAFLTSSQNPVGKWVRINDEIAGWRLVDVRPEQVMLEAGSEKLALKLSTAIK